MNKKRVISYVMAAALLVGGTFAGTKALFTDDVDAVGEISISTGDVDLELCDTEWSLTRNGGEDNVGTTGPATFDNLKTGDVLTKEVKIKNNGTLTAIVNFDKNEDIINQLPAGINYSALVTMPDTMLLTGEGELTMNANSEATVTLKLEVTGKGKHNDRGSLNSDKQEETIIELADSYRVSARQKTAADDVK